MKKLIIGIICTVLLIPCSFTVESRNDEWSGNILFMESYENETTIRKATPQNLRKMVEDALRGGYWGEKERWLEVGAIDPERNYKLVPELGDAEITDEAVPSSYNETFVCIAHYVRNQSKIKEGTYEVEAWFYVPEGNYPLVVLGMEYHPSWIIQYFAHPAIDMKDGWFWRQMQEDGQRWAKLKPSITNGSNSGSFLIQKREISFRLVISHL